MVVGVLIIPGVDGVLPGTEALQGVVSMVGDLKSWLHIQGTVLIGHMIILMLLFTGKEEL